MVFFALLTTLIFIITNNYMESVIQRCGQRIVKLVDSSLRRDMLTEQHDEFIGILQTIQNMDGIGGVNLYDRNGQLHYSGSTDLAPGAADLPALVCSDCHENRTSGLPDPDGGCAYTDGSFRDRNLVILAPVLNTTSCSGASCHAHSSTDLMLGLLEVQLPLDDLDAAMSRTLLHILVAAILFTGGFTTILLIFTRKRIHKPLETLITASHDVSAGNLDLRVALPGGITQDVQAVEEAFNHMLDNIEERDEELRRWSNELENKVRERTENLQRTQHELYHIERLASMGKLSASVAHEINNPLAGVLTYSKLVSRIISKSDLEDERKRSITHHLGMIESETRRCGDIVRGLMDFSRDDQEEQEPIHVNPVLAEVVELVDHSFQMANVTLETEFSAQDDMIRANAGQIKQACMAILSNALEAVPQSEGRVLFRSFEHVDNILAIQIADNGIGISPEDQEHIFEPFFSRKKDSTGIGLGLAVTYGIIKRHDGNIKVIATPGKGTSMTILLPRLSTED